MNKTMKRRLSAALPAAAALTGLLGGCAATSPTAPSLAGTAASLRASETAFARSMADRDATAFASFIADDAVFVNGGKPLRGKAEVLAFWTQRFFAPGTPAPFAWQPEQAEVLADGQLGYTEGPVRGPDGRVIARFHSTWRFDAALGRWLVVFDNGAAACEPARN
jgi:ketosteroid isomerase-like protein